MATARTFFWTTSIWWCTASYDENHNPNISKDLMGIQPSPVNWYIRNMAKPTFLIIGAAKAGTTGLFKYLQQHPEVFISPKKEIHYFDANHDKGDEWYLDHFDQSDKKVLGEASPIYYFYPGTLELIHAFDPTLRLIFLLRNPVDRAISHYWMEFNRDRESRQMLKAFEDENPCSTTEDSIRIFSYKARGEYHRRLDKIYSLFPREQVHVQQRLEIRPPDHERERGEPGPRFLICHGRPGIYD